MANIKHFMREKEHYVETVVDIVKEYEQKYQRIDGKWASARRVFTAWGREIGEPIQYLAWAIYFAKLEGKIYERHGLPKQYTTDPDLLLVIRLRGRNVIDAIRMKDIAGTDTILIYDEVDPIGVEDYGLSFPGLFADFVEELFYRDDRWVLRRDPEQDAVEKNGEHYKKVIGEKRHKQGFLPPDVKTILTVENLNDSALFSIEGQFRRMAKSDQRVSREGQEAYFKPLEIGIVGREKKDTQACVYLAKAIVDDSDSLDKLHQHLEAVIGAFPPVYSPIVDEAVKSCRRGNEKIIDKELREALRGAYPKDPFLPFDRKLKELGFYKFLEERTPMHQIVRALYDRYTKEAADRLAKRRTLVKKIHDLTLEMGAVKFEVFPQDIDLLEYPSSL